MLAIWTIAGVVAALATASAAKHRKHAAATDLHLCHGCATPQPKRARFCRRCGRELKRGGE